MFDTVEKARTRLNAPPMASWTFRPHEPCASIGPRLATPRWATASTKQEVLSSGMSLECKGWGAVGVQWGGALTARSA